MGWSIHSSCWKPKASPYVAAGRIHQATGAVHDGGNLLGELFTLHRLHSHNHASVENTVTNSGTNMKDGNITVFLMGNASSNGRFSTVILVFRGVPYNERKQILEGPIFYWTMMGGRVDVYNHVELGWTVQVEFWVWSIEAILDEQQGIQWYIFIMALDMHLILGCFQHCFQPGPKTGRELTWTNIFLCKTWVQDIISQNHPFVVLRPIQLTISPMATASEGWASPTRGGRVVFFSGQPRILFTALASRVLMSKSLGGQKVVMILGGDGCLSWKGDGWLPKIFRLVNYNELILMHVFFWN